MYFLQAHVLTLPNWESRPRDVLREPRLARRVQPVFPFICTPRPQSFDFQTRWIDTFPSTEKFLLSSRPDRYGRRHATRFAQHKSASVKSTCGPTLLVLGRASSLSGRILPHISPPTLPSYVSLSPFALDFCSPFYTFLFYLGRFPANVATPHHLTIAVT